MLLRRTQRRAPHRKSDLPAMSPAAAFDPCQRARSRTNAVSVSITVQYRSETGSGRGRRHHHSDSRNVSDLDREVW